MRRGYRRLALARPAAIALGAAGISCPSRELSVAVTDDGVSILSAACAGFSKTCTGPKDCIDDPIFCTFVDAGSAPPTCEIRKQCRLVGKDGALHGTWQPSRPMAAQLLIVGTDPERVQSKSKCIYLDIRGACETCTDALDDAGAPLDSASCGAYAISRLVRHGLSGGLSFDDFSDPEAAFLAIAFFQEPKPPERDEDPCDGHAVARCSPGDLVAVGGFARPIGSTTYDLTCASCQNGLHFSTGSDTGPCPVTADRCYLETVGGMLEGM